MSTPNPNEKTAGFGGMSREDLITFVQEIRKPVQTEKEAREEEQARIDRVNLGQILKQEAANKAQRIADCPHMRADGSTPAVYIVNLHRLYCQVCAGWIGPEETDKWNRLYPLATS